MSAHPMIQPSNWSTPPDALIGEWPDDLVAVYRLVWDTTLACVAAPPVLAHSRLTATLNDRVIAAAVAVPIEGETGFWCVRQDEPRLPWPLVDPAYLSAGPAKIVVARPVPLALTMDGLIELAASARCGTPATLASRLEKLVDSPYPMLWWNTEDRTVSLTPAGRGMLERNAAATPALDVLAAHHAAVRQLEQNEGTTADALEGGGLGADRAAQLARFIDDAAEQWGGTSRAATLAAQSLAEAKPPQVRLPKELDPEQKLPRDHPLRELRVRMEQSLAAEDPDWFVRAADEQVEARRAWLLDNALDAELPRLAGDLWRYDALALWLLSASPQ